MLICSVDTPPTYNRVPRATRQPSLIEYDHCGRTVLLTQTPDKSSFTVFIEGLDGECPLRQIDSSIIGAAAPAAAGDAKKKASSPIADLSEFFHLPFNKATFKNGTSASIGDMLRLASNTTNLKAMMSSSPVGSYNKMSLGVDLNEMTSNLAGSQQGTNDGMKSTVAMAAESLGFNASFVDAEVQMMESIIGGKGFADHFGK